MADTFGMADMLGMIGYGSSIKIVETLKFFNCQVCKACRDGARMAHALRNGRQTGTGRQAGRQDTARPKVSHNCRLMRS